MQLNHLRARVRNVIRCSVKLLKVNTFSRGHYSYPTMKFIGLKFERKIIRWFDYLLSEVLSFIEPPGVQIRAVILGYRKTANLNSVELNQKYDRCNISSHPQFFKLEYLQARRIYLFQTSTNCNSIHHK